MSLSAGEAQPYLLWEVLFTVSLQEGKGANQGKMPRLSLFSQHFYYLPTAEKIAIEFCDLYFTAQKDSLPTSSLRPTQLFQQKRALWHPIVQMWATVEIQGPPVAAGSAASPGSPIPIRHQRHMNMCDITFQKEEFFALCFVLFKCLVG